jgi:predicted RNA-binding Zn ribbon-like protein
MFVRNLLIALQLATMAERKSPQLAEPGSPAIFLGNHTALDFLNSIASPVDVRIEWLGNGEAFIGWLQQAGLVSQEALCALSDNAGPGEIDAVAAQARALREWFRGFVQKHRGKPLSPAALQELEPINRILVRDERHGQIVLAEKGQENALPLSLVEKRKWQAPGSLLIPIAESMARLVSDENFTYVKACEGHVCTVLFLDNTRRHARRWCSMAICGNRAKVAAFRARGHGRAS